ELFKCLPVSVTAKESPAPPADVLVPLMSLPIFLETTLDTISHRDSYLSVDPAKSKHFRQVIGESTDLKIGFIPEGASRHPNNANRNCVLANWAPLFNLPRTKWFSLQVPALKDVPSNVVDLSPHLSDMSDTAAAMMNLDLILSVDTSSAHLAGALGRP